MKREIRIEYEFDSNYYPHFFAKTVVGQPARTLIASGHDYPMAKERLIQKYREYVREHQVVPPPEVVEVEV